MKKNTKKEHFILTDWSQKNCGSGMKPPRINRKLTAILSADVQGYSRLMGKDEVATIRTLMTYLDVMTSLIQQYAGRVVDAPGDNLLAEFASVVNAVQCAVEIQHDLKARNADLPALRRMEFRMGINVGDVVVEGQQIYGDGVNITARLEGLAEGGGICISGSVYDQIENKLSELHLGYEDLGEQAVKHIARPVRVYRVKVASCAAPSMGSPKISERLSLPQRRMELPATPSIAILPFTNLSDDPEQEYFSGGLTEDLITAFAKLPDFCTTAYNSVFLNTDQLPVHYVLEGSVRKAGKRVRITTQLADAMTGYHLWAERYDRELQDIFTLQDEVTEKIVAAVQLQLLAGQQERLKQTSANNPEARGCSVRELESYSHWPEEANAQARPKFTHIIEPEPEFAVGHA